MRGLFQIITLSILLSIYSLGFAQNTVTLYLNSEGTNIAVENAEIAVMQSDIKTYSDSTGVAVLTGLEKGFYLISIKHPNYVNQAFTLNVTSKIIERSLKLIPQIDEAVVTAKRVDQLLEKRGFNRRMEQGFGTFITPEEVEKRGKLNPIDIFRNIPGVQVRKEAYGDLHVVSNRRKYEGRILTSSKPCILDVYLDGAAVSGSLETIVNSVQEILAAEVYKGPSTLPPQYNNFNSCGAILLWTKLGLQN